MDAVKPRHFSSDFTKPQEGCGQSHYAVYAERTTRPTRTADSTGDAGTRDEEVASLRRPRPKRLSAKAWLAGTCNL